MSVSSTENPFRVFSPEGMLAEDFHDIFVTEVPGGDIVEAVGHTWLHGPRGSGKSMLLRHLEPDCQLVEMRANPSSSQAEVGDLRFFSLYSSARQFDNDFPELARVRGDFAEAALAEHSLVLYYVQHAVKRLEKSGVLSSILDCEPSTHSQHMLERLLLQLEHSRGGLTSVRMCLESLLEGLWSAQVRLDRYLDELGSSKERVPFNDRVLKHKTFFEPLIEWFGTLPQLERIGHFFVILDDADKLTEPQTRVFNTWLARRSGKISFKFSSEEYQYKTFYTRGDFRVEHPHDFAELNLTDIYTSNHYKSYRDRLTVMINKRLQRFVGGKSVTGRIQNALEFFPEDVSQEREIQALSRRIAAESKGSRGGRDDAYRYGRPEYMRGLSGLQKNRSSYSYSGFDQLVNISSGNPRYFLLAAFEMFDRQLTRDHSARSILLIEPTVQNAVVRDVAQELFLDELDRLKLDGSNRSRDYKSAVYLQQFIKSLGMLFESILYNPNLSERRVFSFAISDSADEEVERVLRLGITHAYLAKTSIGRKEGIGRTERYILSRRFAPYFNLDPNGFSAYKFLANDEIRRMMFEPEAYRKALRARPQGDNADQLKLGFIE